MINNRGFLLIEALIAILLLSLVLTASLGGIAQGLKLSKRGEDTTKAILAFENLLFDFETGERLDLVLYGGRGKLEEGLGYEIDPQRKAPKEEESLVSFSSLNLALSWKEGKESLALQTFLEEVPIP